MSVVVPMEDYEPYEIVAAENRRIGLMTCLRCGSVVMLSEGTDTPAIHNAWHTHLATTEGES